MHEQGFTRVQADGELLHQLWQEDASFGPSLSESLSKFSGTSGPDESLRWLEELVSLVPAGKCTDTYAPWQIDQMLADRKADLDSFQQKPFPVIEKCAHGAT